MNLTIVLVGIRNMTRTPVRSALTILGITVGVAAVVATASIGDGAKLRIEEALTKPESRTIFLAALPPPPQHGKGNPELRRSDSLQKEDYLAIKQQTDRAAVASPRIFMLNVQLHSHRNAAKGMLEGIDVGGFRAMPRQLREGALFAQRDVAHATNVCVISESLAREIYQETSPVNRLIHINRVPFTVLGVVDDASSVNSSSAKDLHVYVPFTSLLRRLDPAALMTIAVQAVEIESVPGVQRRIVDLMEERRSGRKAIYLTRTASDSIKAYAEGSLTIARLLAAVGAIALIVGGVGIMNIMLVSVTERSREIGIRMAIGTRCHHILGQFLAEAAALGLLGGCVGVFCGWAMSWSIARMNDWPTAVNAGSVLTAILCSVGVALCFGYYPAHRAALLRPVEALRIGT